MIKEREADTVIETEGAVVSRIGGGMIHIDFRPVDELTPAIALEVLNAAKKLARGAKLPTLITVMTYIQIGAETRNLWADPDINFSSSAEAMVLPHAGVRLIGNFYLQVHRPSRPTRIFNNQAAALSWLNTFRKPV